LNKVSTHREKYMSLNI